MKQSSLGSLYSSRPQYQSHYCVNRRGKSRAPCLTRSTRNHRWRGRKSQRASPSTRLRRLTNPIECVFTIRTRGTLHSLPHRRLQLRRLELLFLLQPAKGLTHHFTRIQVANPTSQIWAQRPRRAADTPINASPPGDRRPRATGPSHRAAGHGHPNTTPHPDRD